ncbi:hypothetical protein AB1N83_013283 [Pleurotus pulmonarius]
MVPSSQGCKLGAEDCCDEMQVITSKLDEWVDQKTTELTKRMDYTHLDFDSTHDEDEKKVKVEEYGNEYFSTSLLGNETAGTDMEVKTESEMKVEGDVEKAVKMEGVEVKSEIKTEIKDEIKLEPTSNEFLHAAPRSSEDIHLLASSEHRDNIAQNFAWTTTLNSEPPEAEASHSRIPVPICDGRSTHSDHVGAVLAPQNLVVVVEVPSLESVFRLYKERITWEKKNFKKIKKDMVISLTTFAGRYEALGSPEPFPVPLPMEIRDVTVSRHLISSIYGGNVQQTFPTPSAKFLAQHGLADFMCLNYIMNPNAPRLPGSSGFYFEAGAVHAADRNDYPPGTQKRVIMQTDVSKWLYTGQCRMEPSQSLTADEWLDQSNEFRRLWVSEILVRGWAEKLRSRVVLRKRLGRVPTDKELTDAMESTPGFSKDVTADDIYDSFARGEHFIAVWGLKCVGYDTAFQERLVEEVNRRAAADGETQPKKEKKPKPKSKNAAAKRKNQSSNATLRKRRRKDESPSDSEFESSDRHESLVLPRVTRSKPDPAEVILID